MTTCLQPDFLHRLPAFLRPRAANPGNTLNFHPDFQRSRYGFYPRFFQLANSEFSLRIFSEFTLNFLPDFSRSHPGFSGLTATRVNRSPRRISYYNRAIAVQLPITGSMHRFLLLSALVKHCTIALFCLFNHIPAHHVHKSPLFRTNPREYTVGCCICRN